jgi:hypothetical protein
VTNVNQSLDPLLDQFGSPSTVPGKGVASAVAEAMFASLDNAEPFARQPGSVSSTVVGPR